RRRHAPTVAAARADDEVLDVASVRRRERLAAEQPELLERCHGPTAARTVRFLAAERDRGDRLVLTRADRAPGARGGRRRAWVRPDARAVAPVAADDEAFLGEVVHPVAVIGRAPEAGTAQIAAEREAQPAVTVAGGLPVALLARLDDAVAARMDEVAARVAGRGARRLAILARPLVEDAVAADGEAAPGLREAGVGDVGIRRRARGATRRRLARRGAAQDGVPPPLRSP